MSYYAVTWLTINGDIATINVKDWHAAAAERTVALIYGGFHHTAIKEMHYA